ncbi:damage-control phosphatase ARMT1 family protein [Desulfurella sp.]|uniref:damage-control phosphatase ARMT1 family protein n=1 Tax=Desulfurella sp. TaxID=1962857 RepID=UPI003D1111CF
MKVKPECFVCFVSQAIRATEIISKKDDDAIRALKNVAKVLSETEYNVAPPLISEFVYGSITKTLDHDDPYSEIKKKYNKIALNYVDDLKRYIEDSDDKLQAAINISVAGNIIDFGSQIEKFNIKETLNKAINEGFLVNDIEDFKLKITKAKTLLFLADNAGEIVFDKLLLQTIKNLYPNLNIYIALRGKPIINDVTKNDIEGLGLEEIGTLIESTKPTPGFWPDYCDNLCKKIYKKADVIISKGQGNFETLSEFDDDRVFFLFIIKCSVVEKYLNKPKYSHIFAKKSSLC